MNEHGEGYEDSHSDECSPDSEAESGEGMDAVQEEAPRIPHWTDGLAWRFTKKERHAIQSEMNVAYAMTHCPSLRGLVAYDEIKEAVLFVRPAPWDTAERFQPRRWNDTDIAMVRSLLATPIDTNAHHTTGINQLIPTKTVMVGIEMAARERTLNPITDYLKSVRGTWDNIPRVGLLLTRFLGAAPTKIHQEMFTRWMVSAYQRAMRPGCKADHLLIIQGGQGTGKSTFLSVLFKGYHSEDFPRNLHDKDAAYALQDAWVVEAAEMAGETITAKLTNAPGNNAPIGGLKVVTENGWFAARPSGTEEIYKIYAESFKGTDHLKQIQDEAQTIVQDAFKKAGL